MDPYLALAAAAGVALVGSVVGTAVARRPLLRAGISGRDIHKADRPEVAEMGGVAVVPAVAAAVALSILAVATWREASAWWGLATLLLLACVGALDDLVDLRKSVKTVLTFVAVAPFAAATIDRALTLPLVGEVALGAIYGVVLVPLGVASAANTVNMLDGYNGLSASNVVIVSTALAVLALAAGRLEGLPFLVAVGAGAAGFLVHNRYPAKVFPGDTLLLAAGGALAIGAILSGLEFWGALLFLPQMAEFAVKARHGFPSRGWGGELKGGRLHCPPHGPVSLGQWVMRLTDGVTEPRLVGILVSLQAAVAAVVVAAFLAVGA